MFQNLFLNRLLSAAYSGDIEVVRRSVNRKPLPYAREISRAVANFTEVLDERFTMAVLQWGQFLEQDLSRPALSPMCTYF